MCFKQDSNNLLQIFEELSGSLVHKQGHDDLKTQISKCEERLKEGTESLQEARMEKIKMKGIQEFVEQMKDCMAE